MLYCKKKTIENNVGITSFAGRGTVEYTPEINVWQNHLIYEVSTIKKVLIIIGGHVNCVSPIFSEDWSMYVLSNKYVPNSLPG